MNQPEEVGKRFFLMKEGRIKGIAMIEQSGEEFTPWYQTEPFGKKVYLTELQGDHSRTIFHGLIRYFQEKSMAIQTMPEALSKENYRDSLWRLFLRSGILGELSKAFLAELGEGAKVSANQKHSLVRKQIQYVIQIGIETDDMTLVDSWESWLREWNPY